MGVFDWFSRRQPDAPPADLRERLIATVNAKDRALVELIRANEAAIRESFPSWTKVPLEVRNDPAALERYAQMLIALARVFESVGDASLMARLTTGNPTAQWDKDVATAQTLLDEKRATEAVTVLKRVLASLEELSGSGVDHYRPRVLGRLGIALLHTGDRRQAVKITKEALELCRSLGDEDGVRAYTTNLDTIGTFDMPANDGTDAYVTVTFKDDQARTLTLDDLRNVQGKVTWEVRSPASVPPEAKRLHQEGREAGARGDYDAALSLLTRAAELAPSWPYPVYDRAFTHLLQHDFDAALRDYQRTIELAPGGFFTAETAIDTLTRESAGEFPRGWYAAFAMLELIPMDQRGAIAAQLVEKFPSFAAGWDVHADFVADPVERLKAIENGLAARPDRATRGFLMVKKAVTMSHLGSARGAVEMLEQIVSDSTQSGNARAAAEVALAQLSSKPRKG
jgi:tetratricopeptide (TPR) repeat protein